MNLNFGEQSLVKNEPITVYDAANELGLVSRATLCAVVNGTVRALNYELDGDADIRLCTFDD
jgi:hypothetical protein